VPLVRRITTFIAAAVLITAACGDGDGSPARAPSSSPATTNPAGGGSGTTEAIPETTEATPAPSQATTTTAVADPPVTTAAPSGDPAPDFTLALGEGGSFTLSEEQKPVYLVFWAEW
jgi:hypothetical protein